MYGSMEIGLPGVVIIVGEKVIGEEAETICGYQEAGNQETMAGIGDAAIGDKSQYRYQRQ